MFKPKPRVDTVLAPSLRVEQVHDTLRSLGRKAVSTRDLANAIVAARLKADPQFADKIGDLGRTTLIKNEMRKLQREAETRKGKPSVLGQFLISDDGDKNLLWCLPGGCHDAPTQSGNGSRLALESQA